MKMKSYLQKLAYSCGEFYEWKIKKKIMIVAIIVF